LTWAEAFTELRLVKKESDAAFRRLRQLRKKEIDGTITKSEQKELRKLSPKGTNAMLNKMMTVVVRMSDAIDR